ncbi:hypothetical protein M431DRAFT_101671, partial [Trichoderma harzianum CBS 226.95]
NSYRTTFLKIELEYKALQGFPIFPIVFILYFSLSLKLNNPNTCFRYINNISIIVVEANTKETT